MEKERKNHVAHCLILPYPAQGHMNPMIQFSKRLIETDNYLFILEDYQKQKSHIKYRS